MTTPPAACPLIALADADDPASCGGKAAALARLHHAGLPVPDGVVVPTSTSTGDLPGVLAAILSWAAGRAPYGLIARSSAPHEDGTLASFAGLYTSVFTPAEPAPLLAALHRVRTSAAGAAAAYARARGVACSPAMAVLVQPALRPYASGVLAIERDDDPARWRVEAVHGLAEPLVSGRQTGEIHTGPPPAPPRPCGQSVIALPGTAAELRLPPGEWTTLHDADGALHRAKVHLSGDGLVHLHRPAAWADRPVLTAEQVHALITVGSRAAAALGWDRIDVEWALTRGGLHLVQARPLTAPLPPASGRAPGAGAGWEGIAAVPGTGIGPALHLEPAAAHALDPQAVTGAVLICQALGPQTVHLLHHRPSAIVAATGGPLSHTAILAREFGIPCVTAVTDALATIGPGTRLLVDGTAGTVTTVTPAASGTTPAADSTDLRDSAVLVASPPATPPGDGRAATLLLCEPTAADVARLPAWFTEPAAAPGAAPAGLLRLGSDTPLPGLPEGYRDIPLPGMGRLVWPRDAPLPARVVVLGPDGTVLLGRATDPHPGEAPR
ncbi:PEP/pyruvate-binding domain-containing protein [Planomonospora parontospora]|uniref:PEP/pyruvate-binding domain-containing protein n=1 Tax=Planomonospora parontospora TaxID=58119 RepID=UPI0016712F48|nr:PEP/pyruvate-binding domain-containing protein [Planomonospora parontospora]GGL41337.1 hypothetical protein GCM10014719_48240 [Planomonospora parontospora subsp. antibiotica]GII17953.1 hypothetical protein Ppa05_46790 [Planomonospora parontospora subsp. antibiotica]